MKPKFNKATKNSVANQAIREISKMKPSLRKAKTGFGRYLNNRATKKFTKKKMAAIQQIAKDSQSSINKAIGATRDSAIAFASANTVQEVQKNRQNQGLYNWLNNMGGNPSPEKGNPGDTQTGSTTTIGSNELGG